MARGMHGSELHETEWPVLETHSLLHDEGGRSGIDHDGECDQAEHWGEKYQRHCRGNDAQHASHREVETRRTKLGSQNEVVESARLDRDLPRDPLVEILSAFDPDASHLRLEKRVDGKALPPLVEGRHDPIGVEASKDRRQVRERADDRTAEIRLSPGLLSPGLRLAHHAQDNAARPAAGLLQQLTRERTGAQNQKPFGGGRQGGLSFLVPAAHFAPLVRWLLRATGKFGVSAARSAGCLRLAGIEM